MNVCLGQQAGHSQGLPWGEGLRHSDDPRARRPVGIQGSGAL